MAIPMPWPVYSRTTEKPAASATRCTAAPMSESRPPGCIAAMPAASEASVTSMSRASAGVDLAHPRGEGGIAVPALDDRAAVDRDDVALLEPERDRAPRAR